MSFSVMINSYIIAFNLNTKLLSCIKTKQRKFCEKNRSRALTDWTRSLSNFQNLDCPDTGCFPSWTPDF